MVDSVRQEGLSQHGSLHCCSIYVVDQTKTWTVRERRLDRCRTVGRATPSSRSIGSSYRLYTRSQLNDELVAVSSAFVEATATLILVCMHFASSMERSNHCTSFHSEKAALCFRSLLEKIAIYPRRVLRENKN